MAWLRDLWQRLNRKRIHPCDIAMVNHLDFPIRAHVEDSGDKILVHIYKEG